MITFPCAKINLGLNVVNKRADGYHDIETVFYPVPLFDALEVKQMDEGFPSSIACDIKITGAAVDCADGDNLVVKAYELLAKDYKIPRVHAHLFKRIPSQAGLGGGSSDAAFMIRLLDERFRLNLGNAEMERYASMLGADCAFFVTAEPAFASGIGNILEPVDKPEGNLDGYEVVIVKPNVAVSTREAYAHLQPRRPSLCCRDVVRRPIETWKETLYNDFEPFVFDRYPEIRAIKQVLYELGAVYAQMSGSGSAVFGIFQKPPQGIKETFKDSSVFVLQL